jgi:hypothetical protein
LFNRSFPCCDHDVESHCVVSAMKIVLCLSVGQVKYHFHLVEGLARELDPRHHTPGDRHRSPQHDFPHHIPQHLVLGVVHLFALAIVESDKFHHGVVDRVDVHVVGEGQGVVHQNVCSSYAQHIMGMQWFGLVVHVVILYMDTDSWRQVFGHALHIPRERSSGHHVLVEGVRDAYPHTRSIYTFGRNTRDTGIQVRNT